MSHQQSDKHGSAIDEALKDGRHQASVGTRHAARPEDDPVGLHQPDEIELRSEVARFLGPAAFPGDKRTLLATADENNATEEVRAVLHRLADGEIFETVEQVWERAGFAEPD